MRSHCSTASKAQHSHGMQLTRAAEQTARYLHARQITLFRANFVSHPREEKALQLKLIFELSYLRIHSCQAALRSRTVNFT